MQIGNRVKFVAIAAGLAAFLAYPALPRTRAAGGDTRGEELDRADDRQECSNRTLRGDYGFQVDGTTVTGPAPVLLRAVAMTHFDGHGNLTQVDFATMNGVPTGPDWRPATGTYEVNADCTGSAEIVPVTGPPIPLRLVVFDRGRQVATVVIGRSTGSLGTKVR